MSLASLLMKMKFWQRLVAACFLLAAVITWGVIIPALQETQQHRKRFSGVNIDIPAEGRDKSDKREPSEPGDLFLGPLKGHINILRKEMDASGTASQSKNRTLSSFVASMSDMDLRQVLMKEDMFKNKENMLYFDRIAKAFGYSKLNNKRRPVLNDDFPELVTRKVPAVNETTRQPVNWYDARTYPPPKEQSISDETLKVLDSIVLKKKYTRRKRKQGASVHLHSEKHGRSLKSYQKFHNHINQFQLYSPSDPAIDDLLEDLAHMPISGLRTMSSYGTEIKLLFKLADGSQTLFKPMRFKRDLETHPDHYYFDDFERHQAEIAAFHLDKVLEFYRVPPNAGRMINLTRDVQRYADHRLNKTFYRSPVGNVCFYGKCDYYCDSGHSVCGSPYMVEGSCAAMLPGVISAVKGGTAAERVSFENPFTRSYSKRSRAEWEDDMKYCDRIRREPPYNTGRRMLDLVDIHLFDFLTGNMDRHHYHIFGNFGNYTSPFLFDNGRGFGKSRVDQLDILVPLYQCCIVRFSTLERFLKFHKGPIKLSDAVRKSLSVDVLAPVLNEAHLTALDRRVKIILNMVAECIHKKKGDVDKVVLDDGF